MARPREAVAACDCSRLDGMKRRTIQGKPWTAGTVYKVMRRAEA
ncbi:MAG TPA: hypothetical protein VHD36_09560 [Pirellulales bacterium]|nr:hypothetical protein [Pirellulales bacterium]